MDFSIMKKAFSAVVLLLAAVLAAASNEAEELIYNALGKNGKERAAMLIDAAALDTDDPRTALNLLSNTVLRGKDLTETIKKYDALWKKYPHQPDIILCGLELFLKVPGGLQKARENIFSSDKYYYFTDRKDNRIDDIKRTRLGMHVFAGDTKGGLKFADSLPPKEFALQLAEAYFVFAFREKVMGNDEQAKKLHDKYLQMTKIAVANTSKDITFGELAERMAYFFKKKMTEHADAVFELLISRSTNQELTDHLRALYAVNTPDFARAEHEISKIKNILTAKRKNILIYTAAVNAGNWKIAAETVEKLSPEIRQLKKMELAIAMYDGKTIASAGNNPAFDPQQRAMYKLYAASILKDKKLYYEAKEILKNRRLNFEDLNTLAYTASELGTDLDEAYNILQRVVAAVPDNAAYLDSMAHICYKKGYYAKAQEYIQRALTRINPDMPPAVIIEHAADIAHAQGDFYRAGILYKRALMFGRNDRSFDSDAVKNKLEKLK